MNIITLKLGEVTIDTHNYNIQAAIMFVLETFRLMKVS